jgi:transcriptional regulator GlxA family with amidase domain
MRIEIVIFDGYDELDAFGPFEVLGLAAAKGAPFEVALVGAEGAGEVRGSHGSLVLVDAGLGSPEAVVVAGGGWLDRAPAGAWAQVEKGSLPRQLAALVPKLQWTASVCTGAMLLAAAGLLKGRTATTNRHAQADLRDYGVTVLPNRVVDDGTLITAGGITAGLDLALWLTTREAGAGVAREVAASMEYTPVPDLWQTGSATS